MRRQVPRPVPMKRHFNKVFLISLPDRLSSALERLSSVGVTDPYVISAFRGDVIGVPGWWRAGGGAWGCYTSHLHALHCAWQSGVETALIVEDDVIFAPDFEAKLDLLMSNVPDDWGQLYLGGQLRGKNEQVNRFVIRPSRVNRTHAYAVTRSAIPPILKHLTEFEGFLKEGQTFHIDHHYEEAHLARKWGVYAPSWWLCGQGPTKSLINGREEWTRWWHNEVFAEQLPLVVCPSGHPKTEGLHFGYCAEGTWCPLVAGRMHDSDRLRQRLVELKHEALRHGFLPAVSHSFLSVDRVNSLSTECHPLRPVAFDNTTMSTLANYPQNGLIPTAYYGSPRETVRPTGASSRPDGPGTFTQLNGPVRSKPSATRAAADAADAATDRIAKSGGRSAGTALCNVAVAGVAD